MEKVLGKNMGSTYSLADPSVWFKASTDKDGNN